jgi:adenylyltransferase/sulfurtransferase
VQVDAVPLRLDERALGTLSAQCDVVLDCSDNFATRHAVNRACARNAKPLVSGAAIRFDGQIAVFDLSNKRSACYACVFPESGEAEEMRCAVMGVFAPLTGIIGAMQAMEAIKLATGAGETLDGRLLIFDAKAAEWRSVRVRKDPECPVCGASA